MSIPKPEFPTSDQITSYGELSFLYFRSPQHQNVSVRQLRQCIQPPIDLNQLQVFRHEGIPRGVVTWALVNEDVEQKILTSSEPLTPADWRSGNRFWVMEIVAPYGQGTGSEIIRWLKRSVPASVDRVRYARINEDGKTRRFVEIKRLKGVTCGAKLLQTSS